MDELRHIRNDYRMGELDQAKLDPDPVSQFGSWMKDAINFGVEEPTAMTLATADALGNPSARMVLLKGFDERGFVFFTNYLSRKGEELAANPRAALVFYWKELERQVRIEGTVEKTNPSESDEYFSSRPPESQAGAVVSPQSQIIADRRELEARQQELMEQGRPPMARPDYWGGYRVVPDHIEFWQGRPGRLHDRIRYSRKKSAWTLVRLAP